MKLIEAMKRVKMNKEKIQDLQTKIGETCANLTHETPLYGTETPAKIREWSQSCLDLSQDNVKLLTQIQKTNLITSVTIEIGNKQVTKSIAEWVWRRREYSKIDLGTFSRMTDRNLKEGFMNTSTGQPMEVKIQRHYDPVKRDEKLAEFKSEPGLIDSSLEITNAVTDLID